ncbi:MAG: copper amine oxidase N-terminal domain-containing protein, partial [Clostridiales bacterium]|nr:copper amine oxidase N-terminal domain-containing protein [Clostridiales bacterium]
MLKRIIVTVLMLGLMQTGALLANEIAVTIDGAQINFQGQQPTIADGRALVPVRGVFDHLGFDVAWHQDTQEVHLLRAEDVIIITIGDDVFSLDGYEMPL